MNTIKRFQNKTLPKAIEAEIKTALKHYPELVETEIEFCFKENIKKSFMQAQPDFGSFFLPKEKRKYKIFISNKLHIENETITVTDIPKNVLVGWIGHELGHIMDYLNRSNFNLIVFGLKYLFIGSHIRKAEHAADTFAIHHGMAAYILETKNFILNHAKLSEAYKARIKRLYLSPEDIMQLVNSTK